MALFGVVSPILPYVFDRRVISAAWIELLFAQKSILQVICAPAAGYVIDRLGPRGPMAAGLLLLAIASFMFGEGLYRASGEGDYAVLGRLFLWRSLQGAASSLIAPATAATISMYNRSTGSRGRGFVYMGFAVMAGMICGPMLASLQVVRVSLPFEIIGWLCLGTLVFHVSLLQCLEVPKVLQVTNTHDEAVAGAWALLKEPYLLCVATPFLGCVSVEALLTVAQPLHLQDTGQEPIAVSGMFGVFGLVAMLTNSLLYLALAGASVPPWPSPLATSAC